MITIRTLPQFDQ